MGDDAECLGIRERGDDGRRRGGWNGQGLALARGRYRASLSSVPVSVRHDPMEKEERRVILLRLNDPSELFEMPQSDLFSEYRNFLTGVDYCISELRSHRTRTPVRLEISLPDTAVDAEVAERIGRTMRRYCDHRITYNLRERRASRFDGVASLWVGLPVAALGMLIVILGAKAVSPVGNGGLVLDTGGWVLAWVGLWFPLDSILFTPLGYGRENQVLRLLHDAEIVVRVRSQT